MDFVNDLKKSGLYVIGHVRKGELDSTQAVDPLQQVFPYWLSLVDYLKLKAFVELTLSNSIREGIQQESLSQNWNQKRYIDVWPVDLQRPVETGLGWDN
ncbi:hypothetical protein TELCIR_14873, partial [Teladorsagia circumcincta]